MRIATLCSMVAGKMWTSLARDRRALLQRALKDIEIKKCIPSLKSYDFYNFIIKQLILSGGPISRPKVVLLCSLVAKSCPSLRDPSYCNTLSSTTSQSLLKFMSIDSVMLSNHLILCCPLLLLTAVFHSIISINKIIDKYLFHCLSNLTSRSSVL